MRWIHSTHLEDVANLSGCAAALSLYVWTRSGGAPYAESPHRYPVTLGTQKEMAELLGATTRTLRRQRDAIDRALVEVRPGQYTPSVHWRDPWKEGPRDRKGRPLYVRLSDDAVQELVGLSHHAPAQTAHAALRLACSLVVEMRVARNRGKSYATAHNGRKYGSDYPSPVDACQLTDKTIAKAFKLLASRKLIVIEPGKGRRVSSLRGLLAHIPPVEKSCGKPVDCHQSRGQTSHLKADKRPTPKAFGFIEQENNQPSRARARAGAANGMDSPQKRKEKELIAIALSQCVPGMDIGGARHLAQYCENIESARSWVAAELHHITRRDNPAGTLIAMARKGISRPGAPSGFGLRGKKRQAKRTLTEQELQELRAVQARREKAQDERRETRDKELAAIQELQRAEARQLEKELRVATTLSELELLLRRVECLEQRQGRHYQGDASAAVIRRTLAPKVRDGRELEAARQRARNREHAAQLLESLRRPSRPVVTP